MTDEIDIQPLTQDQALFITSKISEHVNTAWELIKRAYHGRAWEVLGYPTWDEYCQAEFGGSRIRLPREERQEVVASLREAGLSVRAIAAATGLGKSTVDRDVAGVPNGTPARAAVTGIDGKTYQPRPAAVAEPADESNPVPRPDPFAVPVDEGDESAARRQVTVAVRELGGIIDAAASVIGTINPALIKAQDPDKRKGWRSALVRRRRVIDELIKLMDQG